MRRAHPELFSVHYANDQVVIGGRQSQRLQITAREMLMELMDVVSPRAVDLICIAGGAYALDRITRRRCTPSNEAGTRTLPVCFQVNDIDYWQQASIVDAVTDLLYSLTGDTWLVSFAPHDRPAAPTLQGRIGLEASSTPKRLALYSGGLDSAAGLAAQVLRGQRDIMLLTIGHQASIRSRVRRQLLLLDAALPGGAPSHRAYFAVRLRYPGRIRSQETSQRARGFLFCASATVLAHAFGISQIDLYENGPGAINLPLNSASLSGGFTTRGAHPAFLKKMADLASSALEHDIHFNLPFLWEAKSAVLSRLAHNRLLEKFAAHSHSCTHTSWREASVNHCGQCPACIERHQAFVGAGIDDPTPYSKRRIWQAGNPLQDDYLRSYLDNAIAWSNNDDRVLRRLSDHCALSGLVDLEQARISAMYRQHAKEVLSVYGDLPMPPLQAAA